MTYRVTEGSKAAVLMKSWPQHGGHSQNCVPGVPCVMPAVEMIEESPPSTIVTSYITFGRGLADLVKFQEHLRVSRVVFLLILVSLI